MSSKAFATAMDGGRHAGTLANYAERSIGEISKGIDSLGKQVAQHGAKIADPAKFAKDWGKLTTKQQEGLVKKWQNEAQSFREQKEILEQLKKLKETQ